MVLRVCIATPQNCINTFLRRLFLRSGDLIVCSRGRCEHRAKHGNFTSNKETQSTNKKPEVNEYLKSKEMCKIQFKKRRKMN